MTFMLSCHIFRMHVRSNFFFFFFFNDTATTEIYTLSLHDALPISSEGLAPAIIEHLVETFKRLEGEGLAILLIERSEEHTSELQSPCNLVCRLLLEKKKEIKQKHYHSETATTSRLVSKSHAKPDRP